MRCWQISILKKPEYIKEVLDYGAQRARKEAEKTMAEVKTAMNVL